MAIVKTDVVKLRQFPGTIPILDVRSPGEYAQAHIPSAYPFPLFNNEERKEIGTLYKQQGQKPAIKVGLKHFGKRMLQMVEEAEKIVASHSKDNSANEVMLHCWRGGMRSAAVAWLLDLYGFKVYVLSGGYKSYRRWVHAQLRLPFQFRVLGGYTGSGKTEVLSVLKKEGRAVIDLEGIAKHRGSAFGNLGGEAQPSQEMFENLLAENLSPYYTLSDNGNMEQAESIWIEDESIRIGEVNLPKEFYLHLLANPLYLLEVPFEERLQYIVANYGKFPREKIVNAIMRIKKRLGGLDAKNAIHFLLENDVAGCFRILLKYYDKEYAKGVERSKREPALAIQGSASPSKNAELFLKL